ncbi:MAG: hypothetical protein RIR51_404 [Bacteroidota bacterium]|jgi:hypothetical protein
MNRIFKFFLGLFLLGFIYSCINPPEFSNTPEISFEGIKKVNKTIFNDLLGEVKVDSVIISVNFKDGDGDLGLTNEELSNNPKYKDFSNFIVKTFIKINGEYQEAELNPPLGGLINFEFLPNQKSGPVEGTISYSTIFIYDLYSGYSPYFKPKNDTLKFQIKLIDNSFNESNVIETDSVIIFQN